MRRRRPTFRRRRQSVRRAPTTPTRRRSLNSTLMAPASPVIQSSTRHSPRFFCGSHPASVARLIASASTRKAMSPPRKCRNRRSRLASSHDTCSGSLALSPAGPRRSTSRIVSAPRDAAPVTPLTARCGMTRFAMMRPTTSSSSTAARPWPTLTTAVFFAGLTASKAVRPFGRVSRPQSWNSAVP